MPLTSPGASFGPIDLPEPIAAYFLADKEQDTEALSKCFTTDALVTDEEHTYRGLVEIQAWKALSSSKFNYTSQPFASEEIEGKVLVTSRVEGDFPGSPVDLRYFFQLSGDKIAVLEIIP